MVSQRCLLLRYHLCLTWAEFITTHAILPFQLPSDMAAQRCFAFSDNSFSMEHYSLLWNHVLTFNTCFKLKSIGRAPHFKSVYFPLHCIIALYMIVARSCYVSLFSNSLQTETDIFQTIHLEYFPWKSLNLKFSEVIG